MSTAAPGVSLPTLPSNRASTFDERAGNPLAATALAVVKEARHRAARHDPASRVKKPDGRFSLMILGATIDDIRMRIMRFVSAIWKCKSRQRNWVKNTNSEVYKDAGEICGK